MSPSFPSALDPCGHVAHRDTSYAPRRCSRRDARKPYTGALPSFPASFMPPGGWVARDLACSDTDRRRVGVRWVRPGGSAHAVSPTVSE